MEAVMKHSDVQRGIEPVYQKAFTGQAAQFGSSAKTEAVAGAEARAAKAAKSTEVRWGVLPRPRLAFLARGLEGALGESGSQGRRFYRVRAPVAGSASRGGCGFRGRHFPRRSKRKRPVLPLGPSSSMTTLPWRLHNT
jgi:hypothetical protein